MKRRLPKQYPGPGGMFVLSFVLHAALFLLILTGPFHPAFHQQETPVTYVDVVTLPVASPQSGTPAPSQAKEPAPAPAAPAAPPPAPAPAKPEMALPQKSSKPKTPAPSAKTEKPAKAPSETEDFNERMARLQQAAEERRLNEQLKKLGGKAGRTGMPGGKGSEAGSDYTSYVRSRIQDAMNALGADHQSKAPKLMVTITVGSDGKIGYRVDKSSGDRIFDDAVARAVTFAGKSIKAPPAGGQFKHGFIFTPEEVAVR
jgi:colicin import membrane protein